VSVEEHHELLLGEAIAYQDIVRDLDERLERLRHRGLIQGKALQHATVKPVVEEKRLARQAVIDRARRLGKAGKLPASVQAAYDRVADDLSMARIEKAAGSMSERDRDQNKAISLAENGVFAAVRFWAKGAVQ
jgi:hypothetical protein